MTPEEVFQKIRRPPANMYRPRDSDGAPRALGSQKTSDPPRLPALDFGNAKSTAGDTSQDTYSTRSTKSRTGSDQEAPDSNIRTADGDSLVVEAKGSLKPSCYHQKGKKILTEHNHWSSCNAWKYERCREATIQPESAGKPEFRLKTASPEHDLRWWLDTPSPHHRATEYFRDDIFTDQHLRDAITHAANSLDLMHQEIDGLLNYAERDSYDIRFTRLCEQADEDLLFLDGEALLALDRQGLEDYMIRYGIELDYVRDEMDRVEDAIRRKKFAWAKDGQEAEMEGLWRLGFVDEIEAMLGR